MLPMKRPRLSAVKVLADNRLALSFIDGQQLTLDLSHDLQAYPGLQPLREARAFDGAILSDDGWSVEGLNRTSRSAPIRCILMHSRKMQRMKTLESSSTGGRVPDYRSIKRPRLWGSARAASRATAVAVEAVPRSLALACLGWDFLQQQADPARAAEDTGRYTVTRKP